MSTNIPLPYRIFFLYIEPVSTLIGAFYAAVLPRTYLYLTHGASAPPSPTPFNYPIDTTVSFLKGLLTWDARLKTGTRDVSFFSWSSLSEEALLVPASTRIALLQLANLYVLFAINEALVLRSTSSRRVWRTLLFGLLIADFGHLLSVAPLGLDVYYKVWEWNAMDGGNVGFVYLGAAMRIAFLVGWGLGGGDSVARTVPVLKEREAEQGSRKRTTAKKKNKNGKGR